MEIPSNPIYGLISKSNDILLSDIAISDSNHLNQQFNAIEYIINHLYKDELDFKRDTDSIFIYKLIDNISIKDIQSLNNTLYINRELKIANDYIQQFINKSSEHSGFSIKES